jgi:hypothetical protein
MKSWCFYGAGIVFLFATLLTSLSGCNGHGKGIADSGLCAIALVQGAADSPLLDEIRNWVATVEYTGVQQVSGYDLLILDGDSHDADAFARELLVDEAMAAGVPVLLLDLTEDAKNDGGVQEVIGVSNSGDSWGYLLIPYTDSDGREQMYIVDFMKPGEIAVETTFDEEECEGCADGLGDVTVPGADELVEVALLDDAQAVGVELEEADLSDFSDTIRDMVANGPPEEITESAAGNANDSTDIPEDLSYKTFTFVMKGTWWPGFKSEDDKPSYTITNTFTVYLNNGGGESFHYIHLGQSGVTYPGGMEWDNTSRRGYYRTRAKLINTPLTDGIDYSASSPETVNDSTTVTDSTSFNIDFKLSKSPEATGTYEVSHSESRSITDWRVDELSDASRMAWEYRQQYPYDEKYRWQDGFTFLGAVKTMPYLSTASMQIHTQSIWKTENTGKAKIQVEYYEGYAAMGCEYNLFLGICLGKKQHVESSSLLDRTIYTIDLDQVSDN